MTRFKFLPPTCLGTWKLIVCKMFRIILTARSTRSSLEACVLTLLVSSPIAMSQTSALCKLIATASSASNCCKCLVSRITILPYCPPRKRNRNGSHLHLCPKISLLTESDSSPLKRLRPLLDQRLSPKASSAKDKGVSVEGLPPLTHTLNAFIKLPR